jgi:hypothetical protein
LTSAGSSRIVSIEGHILYAFVIEKGGGIRPCEALATAAASRNGAPSCPADRGKMSRTSEGTGAIDLFGLSAEEVFLFVVHCAETEASIDLGTIKFS